MNQGQLVDEQLQQQQLQQLQLQQMQIQQAQQMQELWALRDSDSVIAFQLDEPMHNGHLLNILTLRNSLIEDGAKNPQVLIHTGDNFKLPLNGLPDLVK